MITTGINCITSRFGTGMESCQAEEGLANGFIAVPKGWSRNKTTDTFDNDYVLDQIQQGLFIPFVGTFEMTVETPDPTMQESQSGIQSVVRQGKPTFTAIYKKGLAYQKAAYSFNSNGQYDFLITYETGYIKCAETPDGTEIKGFAGGMLNTAGYQENNGSNSAQTVIRFQLTNPLEYNQNVKLLTQLDFDPAELPGITNTVVTGTADASDNVVSLSVVWAGNEQYNITGLTSANFALTVNGLSVDVLSVVYNSVTKLYAVTPDATLVAAQTVVAQLYDHVNTVAVASVGSKFYEGTSASITVTA